MKSAGLFDTETGFAGDETVMELMVLLDSITEFPELLNGTVIKLVGLFDTHVEIVCMQWVYG